MGPPQARNSQSSKAEGSRWTNLGRPQSVCAGRDAEAANGPESHSKKACAPRHLAKRQKDAENKKCRATHEGSIMGI